MFIAARWVLSWPASWLGSACSAMVEYERMSLMTTVTSTRSVSPMRRPSKRSFSASPPGRRRESVSPCSSRSTMAWCRRRRRWSAPWLPALTPWASFKKTASTSASTAWGGQPPRGGDGLDRLALGDEREQRLLGLVELAAGGDGTHEGFDDGGVERGAAGRHRPDGVDELVALGNVVLQEVAVAGRPLGQQRHRVLGVVVLRQDHDPGARVALAHLLGRVDAFAVERRRHADVGHEHVGLGRARPGDSPVEVCGDADHGEVRVPLDEGAHALAHDEVVVGQKDTDRPRRSVALPLMSLQVVAHRRPAVTRGETPGQEGVLGPPPAPGQHPSPCSATGGSWAHAIRELRHLAFMDPF